MKNALYDYGYGSAWKNVHVYQREGYYTSVADFHEHDFYEINVILSGNFKILLSDRSEEGSGNRIVLTGPGTPHFVSCQNDTLYSRIYLLFSKKFIEDCIPEWKKISAVFGEKGRIIKITPDKADLCKMIINRIDTEKDLFRKKLLILYLLSYLGDFAEDCETKFTPTPSYIIAALAYIQKHFSSKLTADILAKELHIGRTTLMTSFKKHTGSTLADYITHCRIKNAMKLISEGMTEQEAAYRCGFGDAGSLIRAFKNKTGITPKKYLLKKDI